MYIVTRLISESDVHFHITGPKLTFKTYNYRHCDTSVSPLYMVIYVCLPTTNISYLFHYVRHVFYRKTCKINFEIGMIIEVVSVT